MAQKPRKSTGYKFRPEQYTVEALMRMDEKTVRAEYKALQKRAHSRLRSFEAAGLTSSQTYQYNRSRLLSLSNMDRADIPAALADAYNFLTAQRGTVRGFREANRKIAQTLREAGFENFSDDADELESFGNFMDLYRRLGGLRNTEGSERAAAWYHDNHAGDVLSQNQLVKAWSEFVEEEYSSTPFDDE